jgi:acyl CoA:acetate/3-ketoacid CoA transferase alpha subunit
MDAIRKLADLLDRLADGESVMLGDFGNAGSAATDADIQADRLRSIAAGLRAEEQ